MDLTGLLESELVELTEAQLVGLVEARRWLLTLTEAQLVALTEEELRQLAEPPAWQGGHRARSRVANGALLRYELHRGRAAPPILDGPAMESFPCLELLSLTEDQLLRLTEPQLVELHEASLPHTSAVAALPPLLSTLTEAQLVALTELDTTHLPETTLVGEWRYSLQRRNAYNLLSRNHAATVLWVTAAGAETFTPPSAPTGVTVASAAGGLATIRATYHPRPDGDNAATTWAIWLSTSGTPDITDPATATETMVTGSGVASLAYTTAASYTGQTLYAIIGARRVEAGPTNVEAYAAVVSQLITATGPAAPAGAIAQGSALTQEQ